MMKGRLKIWFSSFKISIRERIRLVTFDAYSLLSADILSKFTSRASRFMTKRMILTMSDFASYIFLTLSKSFKHDCPLLSTLSCINLSLIFFHCFFNSKSFMSALRDSNAFLVVSVKSSITNSFCEIFCLISYAR